MHNVGSLSKQDNGRSRLAKRSSRASVILLVAAAIIATACGGAASAPPDSSSSITPTAVNSGDQNSSPTPGAPTPGATDDVTPYVPEDSVDTEDKRLNVTVNGQIVYLKNGGQVVLGDGREIEIYLDPFPPTTLRTFMDIYLTENGEPLDDAGIGMEYDMLAMVHGPFFGEADKIGGGHYLLTLDYIMFGAWDQTVTIRIGLDRIRIPVVVVAYP